ncbi:hypothetical protein STCU_07496 [Strigomonas culicis]|uniref:Uncharacterized protein n=1 Tax=Strigomonas culicis TaxID=28005 RepID=S9U4P4_9TRYP|nr:hypothetical protein STCU_07496 [Strigomonas culicis]|eukprot:EPY23744.1 hypothetical protein STCU_07496 [Strigomonas culicis]
MTTFNAPSELSLQDMSPLTPLTELAENSSAFTVAEDVDNLDMKPWDDLGTQVSEWSWPIEVLYQKYHLVVAIDFSRKTFNISRNGVVFVDRVPDVINTLLQVLRTLLDTREESIEVMRQWLSSSSSRGASEAQRKRIMEQMWCPDVLVSIVLMNVPKTVAKSTKHFFSVPQEDESSSGSRARLLPTTTPSFFSFKSASDTEVTPDVVPILSRCDAKVLLEDTAFIESLQSMLRSYEGACREAKPEEWPEYSMECCLEYLVRTTPEYPKECYSYLLVTNLSEAVFTDSVSVLECAVRRKSIIISIVSLSRQSILDSPELSPLTQFVAAVGGFIINIDYFASLSARRVNRDWCRRFEGARCLAQQLFAHLINRFPVASYGFTQQILPNEGPNTIVLFNGERGLPDFNWSGRTIDLLRAVSAARFNEGWSVLIVYKDHDTPAHVVARMEYNFQRGKLLLHYEMNINVPTVYRKLQVSGSKSLVDYFAHIDVFDKSISPTADSPNHFITYLTLMRVQVEMLIKGEEAMISALCGCLGPMTVPPLGELHDLSSQEGIVVEWLNVSTVSTAALFFQYTPLPNSLLHKVVRNPQTEASRTMSVVAAAKALIRRAMLRSQRYQVVRPEENMTYLYVGGDYCPAYIVQFFLLREQQSNSGPECSIASGFECRISGFLFDATVQRSVLLDVTDCVSAMLEEENKSMLVESGSALSRSVDRHLVMSFQADEGNEKTLLVIQRVVTQRVDRHDPKCAAFSSMEAAPDSRRAGCTVGPKGISESRLLTREDTFSSFRRFLRTPCVLNPWLSSDCVVHRSVLFSSQSAFDLSLAQDVFTFMIMRRLQKGATLLLSHCVARRAVLRLTCGEGRTVCLHECISVVPTPNNGHRVDVERVMAPASSLMDVAPQMDNDTKEDAHIATCLHTTKLFYAPDGFTDRPTPVKESCRHFPTNSQLFSIGSKIESVLPYLQKEHTTVLTLSIPACLTASDANELRSKVVQLVGCMGNYACSVCASAFTEDYGQLLVPEKVRLPAKAKVQVAFLYAARYKTVTLLLVLEKQPGKTDTMNTSVINVAIASFNMPLLYNGLAERYRVANLTDPPVHVTTDSETEKRLLFSMKHLIETFTGVYAAKLVMQMLRSAEACALKKETDATDVPVDRILQDLALALPYMGTYAVERDITPLLYVLHSQFKGDSALFVKRVKQALSAQLQQLAYQLPLYSTLYIPKSNAFDDDTQSCTSDEELCLPVLVKLGSSIRIPGMSELYFYTQCAPLDENEENTSGIISSEHWSPSEGETKGPLEWRVRFFICTLPSDLFSMYEKNDFVITSKSVETVLSRLFDNCTPDGIAHLLDRGRMCSRCLSETDPTQDGMNAFFQARDDFSASAACATLVSDTVQRIMTNVALFCLNNCFTSQPFLDAMQAMGELHDQCGNTIGSVNAASGSSSRSTMRLGSTEASSACEEFTLNNIQTVYTIQRVPGMLPLVQNVVIPALLNSPCFEMVSFPVEFTQQETHYRSIDPKGAIVDVFRRCVEEDKMCIVSNTDSSYVFFNNGRCAGKCWIVVHVDVAAGSSANRAVICCYVATKKNRTQHARELSELLKSHIYTKMQKVSQLHLLKQLRDTQNASTELIPSFLGRPVLQREPAAICAKASCRYSDSISVHVLHKGIQSS